MHSGSAEDAARVTIGVLRVLVIALREKGLFGRRVVEAWERGRLASFRSLVLGGEEVEERGVLYFGSCTGTRKFSRTVVALQLTSGVGRPILRSQPRIPYLAAAM
jgi:hypothetical protein